MARKSMRKEKLEEIMEVVKSDVGEDNNFFQIYQNLLTDMNIKELNIELELIKQENQF